MCAQCQQIVIVEHWSSIVLHFSFPFLTFSSFFVCFFCTYNSIQFLYSRLSFLCSFPVFFTSDFHLAFLSFPLPLLSPIPYYYFSYLSSFPSALQFPFHFSFLPIFLRTLSLLFHLCLSFHFLSYLFSLFFSFTSFLPPFPIHRFLPALFFSPPFPFPPFIPIFLTFLPPTSFSFILSFHFNIFLLLFAFLPSNLAILSSFSISFPTFSMFLLFPSYNPVFLICLFLPLFPFLFLSWWQRGLYSIFLSPCNLFFFFTLFSKQLYTNSYLHLSKAIFLIEHTFSRQL